MTGLCRPSSWFVSTVRSRPFLASWLLAALAAGSIGCSSEITGGGAAGTGNTSTNPPPGSGNGGSSGSNNGTFAGNGQFIPGGSTSQNPSAGRPSTTGGSTGLGGAPPGTAGVPTTPGAGMDTGVGSPPEQLADCKTPGPRLVRRLTAEQFHNTLVDVFDDPNVPAAEVLKDPHALGFHVDADLPTVSDLDAELLMNYAETVAAWAVKNKMWRLTSCTTNDQNCRRSFIQTFGRRLQREALPEERVAAYEQIFMAESTFEKGVEAVAAAMLQSPHTLYRRELGQADPATPGQFVLTPFEVASQLSYFLTESGPDDQLLDAAAQGRLNTRQDLDREAARLLGSTEARRALAHFVQGWLEIANLPGKAKDETTVKLPATLRAAMLKETEELFYDAVNSSKPVSALLNANYTFMNNELSAFYGFGGVSQAGFQRVDLTGSKRAPGLLGTAAFLTARAQPENSSPVQRGLTVRERLLCQDLPPVPENLDTNLDPPTPGLSNRKRYEEHSNNAACSGCHNVIDPVGFSFENYDGYGRWRDQENGMPVDASGVLSSIPEGEKKLTGLNDLVTYLSQSDLMRSCLVRYWSYYAHGRDSWEEKKCNHDSIRREASTNGYTVKSVLMGILHAPNFTRRVKDQ